MRLKRLAILSAAALTLGAEVGRDSQAGEFLEIKVPIVWTPNTDNPGAFDGTGWDFTAGYIFPDPTYAASLDYLSQGLGTLTTADFRYYFAGQAQTRPVSPNSSDRNKPTTIINDKHAGFYLEGGPGLFTVTRTIDSTATETISGMGIHFAAGLEFPLFWNLYLGIRTDYFSSVSATAHDIFTAVGIGLPLSF